MTSYGRSPWIDGFPKSRVPSWPKVRGRLDADVVVIGGGLTGCATAYAFAAAGIDVALIESGQVGRGSSGSSLGWVSDDPGVPFADVEQALGRSAARLGWQAWRRAALDFAALVRRLNLKCHLEPQSALLVASTPDAVARIVKEQRVRREAGLQAPLVNASTIKPEVALDAPRALRGPDGFLLDPYRAALGLAAAAAARGARIFEHSPVATIRFNRRTAEVRTESGAIGAKRVVLATGAPNTLTKALVRHFKFGTSYLALTEPVPARLRQQLGRRTTVIRDSAVPPHIVRWVDDERLLVAGADDERMDPRRREKLRDKMDKVIVQRTGQLMYELSTLYPEISGILPARGWDAPYARTTTGLPYIGPHRNFPHQLFAFGDGSHSVTGAYLASRILLRHYLGEAEASDEVFAFRL